MSKPARWTASILAFCLISLCHAATLTPSLPAPQMVGTSVLWTASADSPDQGSADYQFSLSFQGSPFRVISDFSKSKIFNWTPTEKEGDYQVRVVARAVATGQQTTSISKFTVLPRATRSAVVSATPNPLVLLYSAPPCTPRAAMRVRYWAGNPAQVQVTGLKNCDGQTSMNFLVAGLYPLTSYHFQSELVSSRPASLGPVLSFQSGAFNRTVPPFTIKRAPTPNANLAQGIILWGLFAVGNRPFVPPVATDLAGNPVWFYDVADPLLFCRLVPGGTMLMLADADQNGMSQTLREIDLAGNTIRQTNSARISEQLVSRGEQPIFNFSHEALRLPGDRTAVIATIARQEGPGIQGPGTKTVSGDAVIVLDENFQVVWTWNAFEHLDVNRMATTADQGVFYQNGPVANDWTHSNSLDYTPADGNLVLSIRSQDWVVKLDYRQGTGTGDILWRLGKDGDFSISGPDVYPWFSHQHNANFDPANPSHLLVFDNGNTRLALFPGEHSRGQVLQVDERSRQASLLLNADLGVASLALGTAQILSNANYSYLAGLIVPGNSAELIELTPGGQEVYRIATPSACYRAFRLQSLY